MIGGSKGISISNPTSTSIEVGGVKLRKIGEHLKKKVDDAEKDQTKPSKQTKIEDSLLIVRKRDTKANDKAAQ